MLKLVVLSTACVGLWGCAPSAEDIKRVVDQNPDIIYSVIEENPEKFFAVATDATKKAREAQEERALEAEILVPKRPLITSHHAFLGAADAPITIVEYSDLQCPFCARGYATTEELLRLYRGRIKIYFKHLPLESIHPLARPAAQVYEAIALQDKQKAVRFRAAIFEAQDQLNARGPEFIEDMARAAGADLVRATTDAAGEEVRRRIDADRAEALAFGFNGTPAYLINGVAVHGARPIEEFRRIIDKLLEDLGLGSAR